MKNAFKTKHNLYEWLVIQSEFIRELVQVQISSKLVPKVFKHFKQTKLG